MELEGAMVWERWEWWEMRGATSRKLTKAWNVSAMVFGQDRQCQNWARLSGPKYLCRASTQSRRGLVNMWKIIYFHSVWPNLNQDRRKLESPVSMSWEHPLPNAPLPDQTAHLRIRIRVIVKVKWSWSASLFLQLLEIWVYLSPPSPPANPLRARGPSKGTWVVLKWHQQLSLKVLTYFPFDLQWYHQLRINFPIDSEIPLTSPQVSLRPRPSPQWSPPPCRTYQGTMCRLRSRMTLYQIQSHNLECKIRFFGWLCIRYRVII